MVNHYRKEDKEMKELKGLELLKYMALLAAYMYDQTGDKRT